MGASQVDFANWLLASAQFELSQATPGTIASRDAIKNVREAWAEVEALQKKAKATPSDEDLFVTLRDTVLPSLPEVWLEELLEASCALLGLTPPARGP